MNRLNQLSPLFSLMCPLLPEDLSVEYTGIR